MATKKKTIATNDKKLGWHFLPADMKLEYGDGRLVVVGQTLSMNGRAKPQCCSDGMHAAEKLTQAASFKKGPVLCRVEVSGDIHTQYAKFCGRNRKVLWAKALTVKDILACLKSVGYTHCNTELSTLVGTLGSACGSYEKQVEAWLLKWAKNNGCNDGAYNSAPSFCKPSVTEKQVLSLITRRMVRTASEIKTDLAVFNLDDFDDIMDDLCGNDKILEVCDFTLAGMSGYILAPSKH